MQPVGSYYTELFTTLTTQRKKLYGTNAAIWCNNVVCKIERLTSFYIQVKVSGNSRQAIILTFYDS